MTIYQKCAITGVEMDWNHMRKTEDGKWVDSGLYRLASTQLGIPLLTTDHIVEYNALVKRWNKAIVEACQAIRRRAIEYKSTIDASLAIFLKDEDWIASERMGCLACTLNMRNHTELMETLVTFIYADLSVNAVVLGDSNGQDNLAIREALLRGKKYVTGESTEYTQTLQIC